MSRLAELPSRTAPHPVRRSEPLPPSPARPDLVERRGAVLDRLLALEGAGVEQSVTAQAMHDHDPTVPVSAWNEVLIGMLSVGQPPRCRRLLYRVAERKPAAYALAPAGLADARHRAGQALWSPTAAELAAVADLPNPWAAS